MFAAGYDIRTQETYTATMDEVCSSTFPEASLTTHLNFDVQFESVVGFKYLKAVHLNDSKAGLGSKVDRHENIGILS